MFVFLNVILVFQVHDRMCTDVDDDFRYVYVTTLLIYIPIIIVSSVLVISTVLFKPKLNIPHNYIILCLSLVDLCLALVLMPFNILRMITFSNCVMLRTSALCFAYDFLAIWIQWSQFFMIYYLNVDTFIMVKFPVIHKQKMRKMYVFYISFVTISVQGLFVFLLMFFEGKDHCTDYTLPWHVQLLIGLMAFLFVSALIAGVLAAVIVKQTQGQWKSTALLNILLVSFLVTFLPSETYLRLSQEPSILVYETLRLVRYLQPVTNGTIIALIRPSFKDAFLILLRTNPLQWKDKLKSCEGSVKKISYAPKVNKEIEMNKSPLEQSTHDHTELHLLHVNERSGDKSPALTEFSVRPSVISTKPSNPPSR